MSKLSRRGFIAAGATAAAFSIGKPGQAQNSKLNIAAIGAGGRASASLGACRDENIVALCDVSDRAAGRAYDQFPDARRFKDFRKMLADMGNEIDAVMISTPDHTHFPAAMAAMELGKHIYVEKPLAHNVWQLRTMRKAASHYNIISQMGNQGHATEGIRFIKEWYEAGVLGEVKEIFAWFNGPDFNGSYFRKPAAFPPPESPVPDGLDFDLWLGPAKARPYNDTYTPRTWRGWYDFGNGELGDWACHTLDGPFWALDLGSPTVVEAEMISDGPDYFCRDKSIIRWDFPARGDKAPAVLKWYDGYEKPENRPEWGLNELGGSGMIMHGEKKHLMTGGRPDSPRLLVNEDEWLEFRQNLPEKTHARIQGGPWGEWLRAIKDDGPMPGSNFEYSSRLTEMALLGVLAQRVGGRIEWDDAAMKVTNRPELNAYIKEPMREGWRYGEGLLS